MQVPCHPEVALLDIYPREMKTDVYTKTYPQIFIADLFIIVKSWKQPKCPLMGNVQTVVYSYHRIVFSNKKEWTIEALNNLDEFPKNYSECKKPIPIGYILYVSIYITLLKLQNYRNGQQVSGGQMLGGGRRKVDVAIKGQHEDPSRDGNVLYLDFININTLLLILHYSFARCHHWGQLSKAYMRSFYIISYNCRWIYNYV